MKYYREHMNYAHAGYCSAIYEERGLKHITIGDDGDVKVWEGVKRDDVETTCIAENLFAGLQYSNKLLVATEVNTIQIFKYPELKKEDILFRFSAIGTCLARNRKYLAAGSEDTTIKIAEIDDIEKVFELSGGSGPVLSIDLSTNDLLAASVGDGKIRIWDLKTKNIVKEIPGFDIVKVFIGILKFNTPSFEPKNGSLLAYPEGKKIAVLETINWKKLFTLEGKNAGEITCCSFSPQADYIAAGTNEGEVVVWEMSTKKELECANSVLDAESISTLSWDPSNNGQLALTNRDGQVGLVMDINKQTKKKTFAEYDLDDEVLDPVELAEREENDDPMKEFTMDDKEDEDNENCISLEKIKSQLMKVDGDGNPLDESDDDDANSVASYRTRTEVKSYPMQAIFQPGATPESLEHRYLLWNHIGIVKAHENYIDAEFHDAQVHHGINTPNMHNYTMAALSEEVFAIACKPGPNQSSKITCINLVAFGNRQWEYLLNDLEEITGLTAADNIVAIATDLRFLRIFSSKGTQREIISVPGPIVTLAAAKNKIIVAYHSAPATEDQNINVMMITCTDYKLKCRDIKLPLTPKSELRWLGYTDMGSPVSFDSLGYMRLYHYDSNMWMPICYAKNHIKGISDSLYIIKVSESTQTIQAILCRGSKYPLTSPKPIPFEISFQLPLCDSESDRTALEDTLLRSLYLKISESDKMIKENFIKLFAYNIRSEKEARAKELVEMIASPQIIPLAVKYATKLGRMHLSSKISDLMPAFQEKEREQEKQIAQNKVDEAREEDLIANNVRSSLQVHIEEKKDEAPVIAPLRMKQLDRSQRRNPFKKTMSSNETNGGPLQHLTENVVGFSSPSSSNVVEPLQESNKNTVKKTFSQFLEENKERLERENPNVEDQELIKMATRLYRLYKVSEIDPSLEQNGKTEKRKLDENERSGSALSKLARFEFGKN